MRQTKTMLSRDGRQFFKALGAFILIGILLLLGCAGAVTVLFLHEKGQERPVKIAVVNEDADSSFGKLVLRFASGNEVIALLADVEQVRDEAEAQKELKNGAAAALVIPDGFFSSVNNGSNAACRLLLNDSLEGAAETISVYTEAASDLLTGAQRAIFAGDVYLRRNGADDAEAGLYNLELNMALIGETVSSLEEYFDVREIPYTAGGLALIPHYLLLYLLFFFGIMLLGLRHFFLDDCTRGMLSRLGNSGVGKGSFLFWKLVLPSLFALLAGTGMLFAVRNALPEDALVFDPSAKMILLCLLGVIFLICFGSLLTIGAGSMSGGILFLILFCGLFFCGGLIPYSGLSDIALAIGKYTPLGVAYGLCAPFFGGEVYGTVLIAGVAYTAAAVLLAHQRLRRILAGRVFDSDTE